MAEELDIESVFKLKVEDLKVELGKRGLQKTGGKSDLQERLLQYVTNGTTLGEKNIIDTTIDGDETNDIDGTVDENEMKNLIEATIDEDHEEDKVDDTAVTLDNEKHNEDIEKEFEEAFDVVENFNEEAFDSLGTINEDADKNLNGEKNISLQNNDDDAIDIEVNISLEKSDIEWKVNNMLDSADNTPVEITKCIVPVKAPAKIATIPMSSDKKRESRSKRFGGASSEIEKKKVRLGRFSTSSEESKTISTKVNVKENGIKPISSFKPEQGKNGIKSNSNSIVNDTEKIKKRGERFAEQGKNGIKSNSNSIVNDTEKIKKRGERFGTMSTVLTTPDRTSKDRLKLRQEKFADTALKKRQERFGIIQTQSLKNLNTDINARKQSRLAKFGTV